MIIKWKYYGGIKVKRKKQFCEFNMGWKGIDQLELWVISLSDTSHLQYYDVQTLEYRYISKLPMKIERIWSYVKETTSHLQNKLVKV
jgi:hypothetical protein